MGERWLRKTSRPKLRKLERSMMDSSACQIQRMLLFGIILSSDSKPRTTKVATTWEKLSAHQNTQPRHQNLLFSLRMEDSTLGLMVSAFQSLTTIQSHGTQSGRSTKLLLDLFPSGNKITNIHMEQSKLMILNAKMERLLQTKELILPRNQGRW